MNRRRAKQEACFQAASAIEETLQGDWRELDKYGDVGRSGEPWEEGS